MEKDIVNNELKQEATKETDIAKGQSENMPEEKSPSTDVNELQEINLIHLQDKCPAFKEGCPFASKEELPKSQEGTLKVDECPFKNAETLADVHSKISNLDDQGGKQQLEEMLSHIHSVSSHLKDTVGECPVFKSQKGCPFKTVCSDGIPLVEKFHSLEWMQVLQQSQQKPQVQERSEMKSDIELSKELKLGTKKVHRAAENVHFIREFMKGRVEQKIYQHFVASLYFIYRALEREGEKHKDHVLFKKIYFPKELNRLDTLREDLEYFYGRDWEEEIRVSPATQTYIDRIEEVCREDPSLLIPHHYSRYLGDLSGGQILKKLASKTYGLPENGDGVKFYIFENVADPKEFKDHYRQQLDSIGVDREVADKLVDEAKVSFMLNIGLFKELDELSGFVEEVKHEEVDTSKAKIIEEVPTAKISSFGNTATANAEGESSVNWIWIMAVAALLIGVFMSFFVQRVS